MQINSPLTLLAGLSPEQFISEYWQKKPLLIRQAIPNMQPLLSRSELFALATQEEIDELEKAGKKEVNEAKKAAWEAYLNPIKAEYSRASCVAGSQPCSPAF